MNIKNQINDESSIIQELEQITTVEDENHQKIDIKLVCKSKQIKEIVEYITNRISDPYRLLLNVNESTEENLIIRCDPIVNHGEIKCNCPFLVLDYSFENNYFELWKEVGFRALFRSSGKATRRYVHSKVSIMPELNDENLKSLQFFIDQQRDENNAVRFDESEFMKRLKLTRYDFQLLAKYCGYGLLEMLNNNNYTEFLQKHVQQQVKNGRERLDQTQMLKLWDVQVAGTEKLGELQIIEKRKNLIYSTMSYKTGQLLSYGFKVTANKDGEIISVSFQTFEILSSKSCVSDCNWHQEKPNQTATNSKNSIFSVKHRFQTLWSSYLSHDKPSYASATVENVLVDVACNFVNRLANPEEQLSLLRLFSQETIKLVVNLAWNDLILSINKASVQSFLTEYAKFYDFEYSASLLSPETEPTIVTDTDCTNAAEILERPIPTTQAKNLSKTDSKSRGTCYSNENSNFFCASTSNVNQSLQTKLDSEFETVFDSLLDEQLASICENASPINGRTSYFSIP
ncbi:hypothetical protein ACO0QE_004094 [Hanseniaspora vineae]